MDQLYGEVLGKLLHQLELLQQNQRQHCSWHKDTELGHPQPPVRIMEDYQGVDYQGVVCLANGTTPGTSGQFKRAVSYYEALSDRGIRCFDRIPSDNSTVDEWHNQSSSALPSCESFHARQDDDVISE